MKAENRPTRGDMLPEELPPMGGLAPLRQRDVTEIPNEGNEMNHDQYVVIEGGATGLPRIHGPFDTRDEAEKSKRTWQWSRWTNRVEVGVLGMPQHAAYAGMKDRGWKEDER